MGTDGYPFTGEETKARRHGVPCLGSHSVHECQSLDLNSELLSWKQHPCAGASQDDPDALGQLDGGVFRSLLSLPDKLRPPGTWALLS